MRAREERACARVREPDLEDFSLISLARGVQYVELHPDSMQELDKSATLCEQEEWRMHQHQRSRAHTHIGSSTQRYLPP